MDFGVVLPHIGVFAREQVVERLQTVARQAEALGYRSVWAADHIVFPTRLTSKYPYHPEGKFPFEPSDNFLEPLTVLTYIAACTTTIRLGTGVLIIPYRHPVVTAKVVATLDVLSHGRVILGAGVGWMAEEFAFLDSPYRERGGRGDSQRDADCSRLVQPYDHLPDRSGIQRREPTPAGALLSGLGHYEAG